MGSLCVKPVLTSMEAPEESASQPPSSRGLFNRILDRPSDSNPAGCSGTAIDLELTPWLLPRHTIFISHSGHQKDFAEQLCEDLEREGYYPFFDKRGDSLPKGESFPELIFKAARECLLAILLLSEEYFTKSKWPMLELAAFVQAKKSRQDLRILPVLLGLSIEDLKGTAKWSKFWTGWRKQDSRLNLDEWEAAVQALKPLNMILKSSYDGEVALRRGIIRSIIEMIPPDVRSDVLHVQGREHLCKEMRLKLEEAPSTVSLCGNARVLGVYGIGGAGKSTLCLIMTQYVRKEFLGRVCHVELGVGSSIVDLQRKVLRQLIKDNEDFLNRHINTESEGLSRLRERLSREPVFLALDNVWDDATSISNANLFLRLKFHPKSMVLVTSRSDYVLQSLLGIPKSSCMHCPSVTPEEAFLILLEQVNLPIEVLNTEHRKILCRTVDRCFFNSGYHPLALKLFAAQLGTNPSTWEESALDLQESSDLVHPLFSAIEKSFMRLPDQRTRDMFMDIALFAPEGLCTIHEISRWLNDTIYIDLHVDSIKRKLSILCAKSLLEVWNMDNEIVRIHDLYRILAERKATVDEGATRFFYQRGGTAAPMILLKNDGARAVERACFVEVEFEMLGLEACSNLYCLSIRRCEKLMRMSIQRLTCLLSLELAACPLENLNLHGLSNLRWIHVSDCKNLVELDAGDTEQLKYVNVSKCSNLRELNLKNSVAVRSLSIFYSNELHHVNAGSGQKLECLILWFCESLTHVEISGVAHVTTLKKRGCPRLWSVQGGDIMCKDLVCMRLELWAKLSSTFIRPLEISASLQVVDLWHCPISWLPDLRACLCLQELRLSDVDVLLSNEEKLICEYDAILQISAQELDLPISLEDVHIESCRNVVIKEVFLKLQGLRNLRKLFLREVRVGWDWELYRAARASGSAPLGDGDDHDKIAKGMIEISSRVPIRDFIANRLEKVWDDVNRYELVSLPLSQCHGLRQLRFANCRLKNPRRQLAGPWKCLITTRSGSIDDDEHSQQTSGAMYFSRLDQCP